MIKIEGENNRFILNKKYKNLEKKKNESQKMEKENCLVS